MKFTKKELKGIIKICDAVSKVKDMPLKFRSNLSVEALSSNMQNWAKNGLPKDWNLLKANLRGIEADRKEWNIMYKNNTFEESPNLKEQCKNLAKMYGKILIRYPNDENWKKQHSKEIAEIKKVVSGLDNDLYQIFD